MSEYQSTTSQSVLTPEQSADVIRFFHAGDNRECRENGWEYKINIGHSAIRATMSKYSFLKTGEPLLSYSEADEGLRYIAEEEAQKAHLEESPRRPDFWELAANDDTLKG